MLFGLSHGGTESLCLTLLRQAPPDLPQTVLVLDPARRDLEATFRSVPGVVLRFGPGLKASKFAIHRWLLESFRELQPSAVLALTFSAVHVLVASAARLSGIPHVLSHVGSRVDLPGSRWKSWMLLAASHLLKVPVAPCSRSVSRSITRLGLGVPQGSRVIPNGVALERIGAAAERARASRPKRSTGVLGMVARMDESKAHADLLRAFQSVTSHSDLGDTELWLVGDGPTRKDLETLALDLAIADRVRFLGSRSDVAELLGQMDVFVFAATAVEGFGIALVEAMAAGLPIVATDVPACREVLADGAAGLLVSPDDVEAFSLACQELLRSPEQRALWGRRARHRATTEYDSTYWAREWFNALGVIPRDP